jgi:hypothetical protein
MVPELQRVWNLAELAASRLRNGGVRVRELCCRKCAIRALSPSIGHIHPSLPTRYALRGALWTARCGAVPAAARHDGRVNVMST